MKLQRAFFVVIALTFVVSLGALLTGGSNQKAQVGGASNAVGSISLVDPVQNTTLSPGQTRNMTCAVVTTGPNIVVRRMQWSWFQNNGAQVDNFDVYQYGVSSDQYLTAGNHSRMVTIPNITPGSNFKLQCTVFFRDLNTGTDYSSITQSVAMNFVAGSPVVLGCTDPSATNYNPNATQSDGSCIFAPDTIVPTRPTNFTVGNRTSHTLSLSWTASTDNIGVTQYKIYRNNGGTTSINTTTPYATINAPATSYVDMGLISSRNYKYQIRAFDAAGNSSALGTLTNSTNTTASGTTLAVVRPTNLATSNPTQSTITLSWTTPASGEIYDYEIFASTSTNVGSNPVAIVPASGVNGSTFTHVFESNSNITLQPNTTYYFKVRARDPAANKSPFATKVGSNSTTLVSGKTLAATVPAPDAPTNLNVSPTSATTATATWTDNSTNETGFTLQRATNSGFTSGLVTISSTISANTQSFNVTGLSSGATYYFRVRANASTPSAWNTFGPITMPTADTTPPTANITTPTAGQVLSAGTTTTPITVTTNENATCRWNTTDVAYSSMTNTMSGTGTTSHSSTLTGLANGTSYTRYVRCQDTVGNVMTSSVNRSFSVAAPVDTTAPTVPVLSVGAVTSTTIALSWNAVTDPSSPVTYKIYRNGTYIGSPISGISMIDGVTTPLVAGTTYTYTISACDNAPTQNCSDQSAPVTATTTAIPTVISSLEVVRTNGTVVSTLASGQQLNIGGQANATHAPLGGSFSIKANPGTPAPTSIKFDLTGPSGFTAYTQCEVSSPYVLYGDTSPTTLNSWPAGTQVLGAYTLTVTPFDASTCTGSAGTPFVRQFVLANFDDLTPPTNPASAVSTYRSAGEIRLSWTASTDTAGISHYNVTRVPGTTTNVGNQTTFVDTNVNGTATYSYSVTAVDNFGNTSGTSNSVSSPVLSTAFANGDQVQTNTTTNIKVTPDATGNAGTQQSGSVGVITNSSAGPVNPVWVTGGVNYWYVDFASGLDGWVNQNNINPYVPPPSDTTPPAVTITAPTEGQVLATGTTTFTLTVTTNEAATCRWSANNVAYSSMTETFNGTGTTSHNYPLLGLTNGTSYTRYISCIDAAGNASTPLVRNFSVAAGAPSGDPVVNTTCPGDSEWPTSVTSVPNTYKMNKNAVVLCAAVSESSTPKTITLKWAPVEGRTPTSIQISRKTETGSWSQVATPAASALSWTDTNVTPGTYYEYRVHMETNNGRATGYIASGIKVPQEVYRGRLILVIDNTKASGTNGSAPTSGPLLSQVNQLINELNGDKWVVTPIYVSPTATPLNIRSQIKSYYDTDLNDGNSNTNTKAVYLFGDIPVAMIGNHAPDGHSSRLISSDTIYGDMNETWTAGGGTFSWGGPAGEVTDPSSDNRFVKTNVVVELEVGRVDFSNMSSVGNENTLLTSYLAKARQFKIRQYVPSDRVYIRERANPSNVGPAGRAGWNSRISVTGAGTTSSSRVNSVSGQDGTSMASSHLNMSSDADTTKSYLFAFGSDTNSSVSTQKTDFIIPSISDWLGSNWGGVFNSVQASYMVEWNGANSLARGVLSRGKALTMVWGYHKYWYFHQMGMGKTIGNSSLNSINNTISLYTPTGGWSDSEGYSSTTGGNSYMTLLGDPTLRAHYVGMPTGSLSMTNSSGVAAFSWGASSDSPLGYNIYEIQTNQIRKVNSNIISGTSFVSSDAYDANRRYMVTAVKVRAGNSGTYYNESLGLLAGGSGGGGAEPPPPSDTTPPAVTITAPTEGQVLATGTTTFTLTVTTNEAATCRWSANNVAYSSMTETFNGTGTTSHNYPLLGLTNGTSYTRYISCIDAAGNASTPLVRNFSVAAGAPSGNAPVVSTPQRSFNPNQIAVVCNSQYSQSCQVADYYMQQRGIPTQNKVTLSFSAPMTSTGAVVPRTTFETGFGGTNMRAHVLNQITSAYSSAGLGSPDIQGAVLVWRYPFVVRDGGGTSGNCFGTEEPCMSLAVAFAKGQYTSADTLNASGSMPTNAYYQTSNGFLTPRQTHNLIPTFLLPFESGNYNEGKSFVDNGVLADNTYPTGKVYSVSTYDLRSAPRHPDMPNIAALFNQSNLATEHTTVSNYNSGWNDGHCQKIFNDRLGNATFETSFLKNKTDALAYHTGIACPPYLGTITFKKGALADHLTSVGGMLTQSGTSGGSQTAQMAITEWLKFGVVASAGTIKEPWDSETGIARKFSKTTQLWTEYYTGASALQAYWSAVEKNGNTNFVGEPLANPWKNPQITFSNNTLTINTTHIKPGETWKLQSSTNGTSWTDVSGQTSITAPNGKLGIRTITVSNATAPYYRLVNTNNASLPQIVRPVNGVSGGGGGEPPPPPSDTTPPTANIATPTAGQVLSAGTTTTPITVTTNENATCRWNTTDVAYSSMTNTMSGTGTTSHSSTLTGLANGTSYTRYVRCQDTVGNVMTSSVNRSFSVAAPVDTTAPTVPGTPTVSGTTSSSISLSWTASTDNVGVTGYKIFRSTTSGGSYTEVGTSTSNSHTDGGLPASSTFFYKISAYDAAGNNSAQSSASSGIATQAVQSGGQTVSGINGPVGPNLLTNATSCTNPSGGTVYYVDSIAGSDSNNGTSPSTAWRSIAQVNSALNSNIINAGKMVCFKRGGVYRGKLTVSRSGTPSSPIRFDAYGNGPAPVISGNVLVTNWTQHSGNIWKATIATPVSIPKYLFVGGQYQNIARHPNTGWYFTNGRTATSISDTDNTWLSSQATNSLNGSEVVMRGSPWSYSIVKITGNSGTTMTGTSYSGNSINYGAASGWQNLAWGYFFRNKLSFLDTAGEWYFDGTTNTVYLWAPNNANPNTLTVELTSEAEGVYISSNQSDIIVKNLIIEGQTSYAVRVSQSKRLVFENLEVRNGYAGIHQYALPNNPSSDRNIFRDNYVHDLNVSGITIEGGNDHLIEGNVVKRISMVPDRMYSSSLTHIGIAQMGINSNITSRRNIVTDIGYAGITAGGSGLITENLVERTMQTLTDGSGITFDSTNNLTISKNIVKDTGVGSGQNAGLGGSPNMTSQPLLYVGYTARDKGLYFGDSSGGAPITNTVLDSNVVINSTDAVWVDHSFGYTGNKVINNILFDFNRSGIGVGDWSMYRGIPAYVSTCDPVSNSPCFQNYDNVMTGNKIYGIASHQNPLYMLHSYSNGTGAVPDLGTVNYNYYSNPYRTIKVRQDRNFNGNHQQWTLAQWQASSNEDANSTAPSYTPTQPAQIFYNATLTPMSQTVNGCRVNGQPVSGSQTFTIQPFTAIVVEYGNC